MALTDVEVCNGALAMIGASSINSLTDGTTAADICNELYSRTVENEISTTRWRFAMGQEQITRLTDVPDGKWSAAYQLPATLLTITTAFVGDRVIEFDRFEDKLYCDAAETEVVVAQGHYRIGEEKWPAYFSRLIELRMASLLAQSLAERTDLANMLDQKAMRQAAVARNIDSQGRSAVKINTSRITARRFRHGHDYAGYDY